MIGVAIPAHNEAAFIEACLTAIRRAAAAPDLLGEPVVVAVTADACRDATRDIALAHGAHVLDVAAQCVGIARGVASDWLIRRGARWIASTDADTCVNAEWLTNQMLLSRRGWDAVCGIVDVDDWSSQSPASRHRFLQTYTPIDHHRHVHGASLGLSASAYTAVGGWPPRSVHEDVELIDRLAQHGHRIAWTADVRAVTSGRRTGRASGGFADTLTRWSGTNTREDTLQATG